MNQQALRLATLAALLWLSAISSSAQQRAPLVLITIDTLRADHLPSGGATDVSTPALERLARQGVVFEQAVTTAPLTLPAHASLMTGTYPHFHGVRDNSGYRLGRGVPTLADDLRRRGYQTAAFLGSAVLDRSFGLDRGFDFYGDRFGETAVRRGVLAERRAVEVVDEALGWLRRRRPSRPFFVWLHLFDPHAPYEAPGQFASRGYKGEIEYVDSQLARLFAYLDAEGLYQSSLIVVVADHGEDLEEHGEPTHGFFLYETVMRIPWLMKLPGGEEAGTRVPALASIIDVAPTVRQVLRLEVSPAAQGSGRLAQVLGKPAPEGDAYAETLYPSRHFGWSPLFSLRTARYKYIEAPRPELYDLREDPGERHNLAPAQSALAGRFGARLGEIRRRFEGEEQESSLELDPELRARLSTLGYITGSGGAPAAGDLVDPKEKIAVYAEIYRGMEAFTVGNLEGALTRFRAALARDSRVPLAHDYLGSTQLALGKPEQAIESYKRALELAPGRPETSSNLAYAYLEAGRFQEAEAGFELVTRLSESDWQAWQLLGVTRLRLAKLEGAVAAFRKADELSPANRQVLFNLGTAYQQLGQHLLAMEALRRLVQLAPEDVEAWNSLATSYDASNLSDQAEDAFRRALALDASRAETYFNYANFFARRQELARAEELYRKAISVDAGFALAYRNLAAVLQLQGKENEAAEQLRRFQQLGGRQP